MIRSSHLKFYYFQKIYILEKPKKPKVFSMHIIYTIKIIQIIKMIKIEKVVQVIKTMYIVKKK